MDRRASLIAKIHIAKQQLDMDDHDYRAMLKRHGADGEQPSSRTMRMDQLAAVLNEMMDKGWRPAPPKGAGRALKTSAGKSRLISKIEALLADKGARQGRVVPWSYADAIAKRVCGVDKVFWCDENQLRKVVAALEYHKRRDQ